METRRLAAASGASGSSGSRSARPATLRRRFSPTPFSTSRRRVALARSADRSQLLRASVRKGVASVWPVMDTALGTRRITEATLATRARERSFSVLPPEVNIGLPSESKSWIRNPSGTCSTRNCCASSARTGSPATAARSWPASCSSASRSRFSSSRRSAVSDAAARSASRRAAPFPPSPGAETATAACPGFASGASSGPGGASRVATGWAGVSVSSSTSMSCSTGRGPVSIRGLLVSVESWPGECGVLPPKGWPLPEVDWDIRLLGAK